MKDYLMPYITCSRIAVIAGRIASIVEAVAVAAAVRAR